MRSFLIIPLIFISVFIISFAQAQDDGDPGKQNAVKRNRKAQNEKQDSLSAELSLSAGWVSNIFRTPTKAYVDPATGTLTTSQVKAGTVVNPKVELKYEPIQKKSVNLKLSYEFDGEYYFGPENASNASGNDQEIAIKSKFLLVDQKNEGLEKVYVKVGAYINQHDYSFYHRGTGKARTTSSLKDEEDRYKRTETGFELEPRFEFSTKTQVRFPLGLYSRNYNEINNLQSFDRDGVKYGIEIKQEIPKNWSVKAAFNSENTKYDKYKALNSTGTSVTGTNREHVDQEYLLGVDYDSKLMFGEIVYRAATRNDLYADYWSYDQEKVSVEIGRFITRSSSVSVEGSILKRRYQKETAPSGEIRKRENQLIRLSYDKTWSWGKTSLDIAHSVQNDTDLYYQYSRDSVMLGFNKEF